MTFFPHTGTEIAHEWVVTMAMLLTRHTRTITSTRPGNCNDLSPIFNPLMCTVDGKKGYEERKIEPLGCA